jgi:hypothetical protein
MRALPTEGLYKRVKIALSQPSYKKKHENFNRGVQHLKEKTKSENKNKNIAYNTVKLDNSAPHTGN